MSYLNKLTLVIPSYNRPKYLLRSLQYWSNKAPRILVFDASPEPIDRSTLDRLGDNVIYTHAPVSFKERFKMVGSKLKTPYVALLADDDFYLPSALDESIEYLEKHADYSACIGRPIGFRYDAKAGVVGIPGVYGDMNNDYGVFASEPGQRMLEHMGRYMPSTIYAVLRTTNWEKTIEGYIKKEFPGYALVELQMEMTTAYLGKSVVLPALGWLKSTELEQMSGPDLSLQRVNNKEFHEMWPGVTDAASFRAEFITFMADLLSQLDQRPQEIVAKEVEVTMDAYVAWCYSYFRKATSFYGLREYLKCALPVGIVNLITLHLRSYRLRRDAKQKKQSLMALAEHMKERGTRVNMAELQEISDLIQEFHRSQSVASLT